MDFGAIICKPKNPRCDICNLKNNCNYFKNKNVKFTNTKFFVKEKKYNIYCYLRKQKKQIALTKNKNLSFLKNFNIPKIQLVNSSNNRKKVTWIYLCTYKNSISNIKMNINLFYKFTKNKPKNYKWYSTKNVVNEFIPTFTKKIINKINKVI